MANMKRMSWVIDQLPGVRPRLASVAIKNGLIPGVINDIHSMHGDKGPSFLVGPDAAKLIQDAYNMGKLPMEPGAVPTRSPGMDAYLGRTEGLRAEADTHRRHRIDADPFADWRQMEEMFRRSGHPVPETMSIGEIKVERRSEHGSRDPRPHEIRFHWQDKDGAWLLDREYGRCPDD